MRISSLGNPARIVRAADEGTFDLVVSESLLRELRDVLLREKFRRYATVREVAEFVAGLREKGVMVEEGIVEPASRDPKDEYLLALARASDADFLISGDQHLHALEGEGLPRAITPRDFVDFLEYETR